MEWKGRRRSRNVQDRRRMGGGAAAAGGGVGVLAIVVIGALLGVDLTPLMNSGAAPQGQGARAPLSAADEERAEFAAVVLADTEEVWTRIFREQLGRDYQPPQLVLFSGATDGGACGRAMASTGPFYCPANRFAFLDTDFFVTLDRQLGAKGDFAAAYVIAHEVAHHVQNELGTLGEANRVRAQSSQTRSNEISVRIELQADCYSGIWARYAGEMLGVVQRGDIAEAMNAAKQIGDDALQRGAGQRVRPDSFTHGTSEQRQRWFLTGYEEADLRACDTFSTRRL